MDASISVNTRIVGRYVGTIAVVTPRWQLKEELRMRTWLISTVLACTLASSTGCLIPIYSADPARRAQQLFYTSENLRALLDEWERIWFLDMPTHLTPHSVHGGII
jgi:hypothetical protein